MSNFQKFSAFNMRNKQLTQSGGNDGQIKLTILQCLREIFQCKYCKLNRETYKFYILC